MNEALSRGAEALPEFPPSNDATRLLLKPVAQVTDANGGGGGGGGSTC